MENPTFDFYLTNSYEIPKDSTLKPFKLDSKLIYEFLNSKQDYYFQRFYVFEDNFVILEEHIDNKVTIKSNKKIIVDDDFNVTFAD